MNLSDSFADVGCGPGVVTFHVAERYPEMTVVGYVAAESILIENHQRASENDIENVRFEPTVLPNFGPDRQFDLVLCFGTLAYVAVSECAPSSTATMRSHPTAISSWATSIGTGGHTTDL